MSFDWLGYLTLAQYMKNRIADFPDEEACCRSIISRSYYAAFCLTRNFFREVDGFVTNSDDHRALQTYLLQHPHKDRKKLGNQLRLLHQHRKKADYDDDLNELAINKATRALTEAEKIVKGLKQLSS